MKICYVFLGGGLGSLIRFGFQYYIPNTNSLSFPTLSANLISCLILGYLAGQKMQFQMEDDTYLLLATGFCGGFSTFSTLVLENWQAIRMGKIGMALLYSFLSLGLGLLTLFIGFTLSNK